MRDGEDWCGRTLIACIWEWVCGGWGVLVEFQRAILISHSPQGLPECVSVCMCVCVSGIFMFFVNSAVTTQRLGEGTFPCVSFFWKEIQLSAQVATEGYLRLVCLTVTACVKYSITCSLNLRSLYCTSKATTKLCCDKTLQTFGLFLFRELPKANYYWSCSSFSFLW